MDRRRKGRNEVTSGEDFVDQEAKKPGPGGDDGGPEGSGSQTQGLGGGPRGPEGTGKKRGTGPQETTRVREGVTAEARET